MGWGGVKTDKILHILLVFFFSFTILSCSEDKEESTTDITALVTQMGGSIQGVELSLSALVNTVAGTGSWGSANGAGTSASFYNPEGITTDGTNLYVADRNNHLIRKIE